jgi:hypothetical protein
VEGALRTISVWGARNVCLSLSPAVLREGGSFGCLGGER